MFLAFKHDLADDMLKMLSTAPLFNQGVAQFFNRKILEGFTARHSTGVMPQVDWLKIT
jgi:hypothetical protein